MFFEKIYLASYKLMEQLVSFLSLADLNIKDGDLYMKKLCCDHFFLKIYYFISFFLYFLVKLSQ